MTSHQTDERQQAEAHAEFFATHGFADVGVPLDHPHGHGRAHAYGTPKPFGRARHGSVRAILLWALAEKPMHGYQIISELDERSGGFWKLSSGSVYPTLQQLADEGLVTATDEGARRVYRLSAEGRPVAQAIREGHGAEPWAAAKGVGERRFRLWRALSDVAEATRRVALEGTEEQADRALTLLEAVLVDVKSVVPTTQDEPA
jgi:DNA-binding PadR family transcriptional regulator